MNGSSSLIIQDVRCFRDEQRGRMCPITLLVGENSTGKTTFLGCYGVLHQVLSTRNTDGFPDFNETPFVMGSFREIVHARRGRAGRIDAFRIGLSAVSPSPGGAPYTISLTFREDGSQAIVTSLRLEFDADSFVEMHRRKNGSEIRVPNQPPAMTRHSIGEWRFLLGSLASRVTGEEHAALDGQNLKPVAAYLRGLFSRWAAAGGESALSPHLDFGVMDEPMVPISPLRSKPKRTYDPVRETAAPSGDHIPMFMMRLKRAAPDRWKSLRNELAAFGREAGLFSDIDVRLLGKQMGDPFQLQVKVRKGPNANIMDVGYGISQTLPILVDVMVSGTVWGGSTVGRTFLLQQPEVHLHPRGQAELANLFIEAFRKRRSRFLIETHSDYLIDRVRLSVRRRMLEPEDVSILYFEPSGSAVAIHDMSLDKRGNLIDAPAGYRSFFENETDRLLGFDE